MTPPPEHVDVLVMGAGLSGIGAAARLAQEHPQRSYAVLEAREVSGGTWDLFRYPGIRSDSDMFTMGYRFRPWRSDRALADGPSILAYVRDTATAYGVDRHIRYQHRVTAAAWDSASARWTVTATTPDGEVRLTAGFLWACSGYYDYDEPYRPELPGLEQYAGTVVHPQHWPEDLDTTGKRVVVIGSGATAMTLVPSLADAGAGQVTMLQRSPTYVLALPGVDPVARVLRRWLPERLSYWATRWKNIGVAVASFQVSRRWPRFARKVIRKAAARQLPEDFPVDVHFRPTYDPWDQRLCLVPDGDLFRTIREGRVDVVTDTIETFVEKGVRVSSGDELLADVVVTATGFNLKIMGGAELSVDGEPVDLREKMAYRALMFGGVPNFAFTIGYTNASWTLKADLVADYVCRLLAHLDATGHSVAVPVPDPSVTEAPFMDFTPGYVQRSMERLPKQGDREPWRLRQNYFHDVRSIRRSPIDDGVLRFH
ncbi:flavin-containing monooxygenase [Nocardioides euryhalodurans]|uniref:NAD(P)/FAD-dependent oxidoreductase n=1 Tax=Nocardioides euryhalodurans TaxID=2518370 RepID=A0A4P7GMM2_9ACTN|nr:NAD(P)/FAD-dependent oxidoreductase [Nocardioides euryhalodurans]QBR93031.1 NAD(P)/FAD-dependent oxidoreductase [Nocardioides euryhalodurans]